MDRTTGDGGTTVLTELATAAAAAFGTAVVEVATSDVWVWFRGAAARLLGRASGGHEAAEAHGLESTAQALAEATDDETRERLRAEHAQLWNEHLLLLLGRMDEERQRLLAEEIDTLTRAFRTEGGPARGTLSGNTFHGPTNFQTGDHSQMVNKFGVRE
ncbi:hypothetical protein [Streptomyces sp. NPDC047046]|uniref:hypothetical protein n=1 Tax=Streptomyces sp. NPDC047046 TaxID=3155378 RepID=UPI0033F0A88B